MARRTSGKGTLPSNLTGYLHDVDLTATCWRVADNGADVGKVLRRSGRCCRTLGGVIDIRKVSLKSGKNDKDI